LLRAELTSRIAGAIDELELERQNEVAIDLFSAKESVTSNIFPVANNSAVFDLVFAGSSSLSPACQGLAVEE
jgi:4'-phosphopantetheinyl transferase EntD